MTTLIFTLLVPLLFGVFVAKTKYLNESSSKILNSFVFNVSVPVAIFVSVSKVSAEVLKDYSWFAVVNFFSISLGFIVFYLLLNNFIKDKKIVLTGMITTAAGNVVFFGIPIVEQTFGKEYVPLASIYSAVFFLSVTLVALPIIQLHHMGKVDTKKLIKNIAKNPILHSNALSFAVVLLAIQLPKEIMTPLQNIASTTTPLAIFALGFYLATNFTVSNIKYVSIFSVLKLLILPLITSIIAILLISNQTQQSISILQAFMPTATLALVISDEYMLETKIAGATIIVTTTLLIIMLPLTTLLPK